MKIKRIKIVCLILFAAVLIPLFFQACSANRSSFVDTNLQSITLIDRNGMTETVNNPERIQQYQTINFFNPQPYEKILRIHGRSSTGNIPSFLHSYHENGVPKQYLEVVNSRALGLYREWHPNGQLKVQACVVGGEADLSDRAEKSWIFDEHAYAWDEEGNLVADISYDKGVLHGDSLYYHPNGALWRKLPYFEGGINGCVEVTLDDGTLFQTTEYVNGAIHGKSFRYWEANQLAAEEDYQDNHLISAKYFDKKGKRICEVENGSGFKALFGRSELAELHEFKNGVPEGIVKVFGTDGELLRSYYIKNGLKHGEEVEYYELPHLRHVPKLLLTWHEGKIQGETKSWYDNGVQESNRQMSNNTKYGISTAWYRDGSLMLIEDYQQDKLLRGEYFYRGEKKPVSTVKQGDGMATLFDPEGNFIRKIIYEKGLPSGTE